LVVGDQLPDVLDKMGGRHALILRVAWANAGRQAASMIPAPKVTNCPVVGRQKSGGDHLKQAKNYDFMPQNTPRPYRVYSEGGLFRKSSISGSVRPVTCEI
jgi:hypothetical protein